MGPCCTPSEPFTLLFPAGLQLYRLHALVRKLLRGQSVARALGGADATTPTPPPLCSTAVRAKMEAKVPDHYGTSELPEGGRDRPGEKSPSGPGDNVKDIKPQTFRNLMVAITLQLPVTPSYKW